MTGSTEATVWRQEVIAEGHVSAIVRRIVCRRPIVAVGPNQPDRDAILVAKAFAGSRQEYTTLGSKSSPLGRSTLGAPCAVAVDGASSSYLACCDR